MAYLNSFSKSRTDLREERGLTLPLEMTLSVAAVGGAISLRLPGVSPQDVILRPFGTILYYLL